MAHEIKLEVYTFKIRPKNQKDKYWSFHDTFAIDGSVFKWMQDFIKYNDKLSIDESKKKSMQFLTESFVADKKNGIFSGVIESGDYGTASDLIDRKSKKKVYRKRKDDIDVKPFYFLIWVPKERNVGFVILQRTGVFGIHSVFTTTFSAFVESKIDSLLVDFEAYSSKSMAERYLQKGMMKEISLRRYHLPPDVVDQLGLKQYEEEILSVEVKIRSKNKGFSFGNLFKNRSNHIGDANTKFFSIGSVGMDGGHKEKVKVKLGSSTRTIDLSDNLEIRPYFDIDKDVTKDLESGLPTFKSIDAIAKGFIKDIQDEKL